jgi:hypothetical protein
VLFFFSFFLFFFQGKLDDPDPRGLLKRVQHPAGWGCFNASVTVTASADNKIGWLQGSSFPAEIRLSKGNFDPDSGPKVSAIAVKIHGVNGPRAQIEEQSDKIAAANKVGSKNEA